MGSSTQYPDFTKPAIKVPYSFAGCQLPERWYGQKSGRAWNDKTKKVDISVDKGFYTAREMSFSLSATTAIFEPSILKKKNIRNSSCDASY
jgi:hypothetical protein